MNCVYIFLERHFLYTFIHKLSFAFEIYIVNETLLVSVQVNDFFKLRQLVMVANISGNTYFDNTIFDLLKFFRVVKAVF